MPTGSGSDPKAPKRAQPSASKSSPSSRPAAPRPAASRPSRGRSLRGRSRAKHSPSPPSLAWAKWIEALGYEPEDPEEPAPAGESTTEARLRAATEAARLARMGREQEGHAGTAGAPTGSPPRATSPVSPAPSPALPSASSTPRASSPARPTPPGPLRVPPRHAPGAQVKPLSTRPAVRSPEIAVALAPVPPPETAPPFPPPPTALPLQPAPPEEDAPRAEIADDPLPLAYGEDGITLLCKDPYWLHAYWEITELSQQRALESHGQPKAWPCLRLHHYPSGASATSDGFYDVGVSEWRTGHQYLHCGRPDAAFEVEIGLKTEDGRFVSLARSKRVITPPDRIADVIDEEWTTAFGEQELTIVTARAREEMASMGVSSFGGSAGLARPEAERGFWFVLGTELVVYGATEPDASVTCQGRPVVLRSDGTFTLRFALPDGVQEIPCAATSADRGTTMTITTRADQTTRRQ